MICLICNGVVRYADGPAMCTIDSMVESCRLSISTISKKVGPEARGLESIIENMRMIGRLKGVI